MIIRINCEVIFYPFFFFWTRKDSVNQLSSSVLCNCLMLVAEKILKNISHKMLKSGLEAHLKASVLKPTRRSFKTKVLLQCISGQKIPAKEQKDVTTLPSPPSMAVHVGTWHQLQASLRYCGFGFRPLHYSEADTFFGFPVHTKIKFLLYCSLLKLCNNIMSKRKKCIYFNFKILYC